MEGGVEEVALEFELLDGCFRSIHYRALHYQQQDYLDANAPEAVKLIAVQFEQLISYLVGKPVSAVNDLYQPGNIASDADVFAGATLRAPKVISAIWDALNRHAYRID